MAPSGSHPVLVVSLLLSVLHMTAGQQSTGHFLQSSSDTYVEPYGQVALQCQISPSDLPQTDPLTGQSTNPPFFSWKFRKTGQTSDPEGVVNWDSTSGRPWIKQKDVMNVVGNPGTGQFNLQITNVTYDSHDGDYTCEVSIPASPGVEGRTLRSKTFHLYVKYQPQSPQVEYSVSRDSLREEERLVISCGSRDGNPPPLITWWRNGGMVKEGKGVRVVYEVAKGRHDVTKADLVLEPLSKENDKAVYTCRVENPSLSQPLQKTLDPLNVHYKPRVKVAGYVGGGDTTPFSSLSLEPGTEATLTCVVDANPLPSPPSWRKNGQLFQQSTLSQPNQSSANFTLTQGALTRDAAGVYSCVAVNGIGGEVTAEMKVEVFYPPVVSVVPAVSSLKEGASTTLHCQVDSQPLPDGVEWYNPRGERVGGGGVGGGNSLLLSDVKRPEAGLYECRAKVHFVVSGGTTQVSREGRGTGKVDVQYKPGMAVIEPTAPRATVGNRVSIKCSATDVGLPPARFRWRKLDNSPSAYAPSTVGEYFNITEGKLEDNGEYECTPFNDVGEGEAKVVRVEVSEAPSWTSENVFEMNLVKKVQERPLSLFCSARGRPAPSFKWMKDGVQIAGDDKMYRVVTPEPGTVDRLAFITRSELKFEGSARTELFSANNTLQRTDRGKYTCTAGNDVGQPITRETQLFMQYAPEFVNRYSKVATDFSPTSSVKIECLVESNPAPTVRWTRNNQDVISTTDLQGLQGLQGSQGSQGLQGRQRVAALTNISKETFTSVLILETPTEADLGEYVCTATNLLGENTKSFFLVRQSVPDEPKNLKQKDLDYNGVTLTWDQGFDGGFVQKFTIIMTRPDRSTQEFSVGSSEVATVGSSGSSEVVAVGPSEFRVTGLQPLTVYSFRVRSENQLGVSRGTSETIEVRTLQKPVLAEDIPRPSMLVYEPEKGLVTFGSRESAKELNLCAWIEARRSNENTYNLVTRCTPFKNNEGVYSLTSPSSPASGSSPASSVSQQKDQHIRIRFCLYDKQDVCGNPVDEQSVLLLASTSSNVRLDILLPIVIILAVVFFGCLITCIVCRRRARRTPVKTAKASNLTLTTHGSVEGGGMGGGGVGGMGGVGGFYGSDYASQALQESGANHGIYATHNSKLPQYGGSLGQESQYGNGILYAQVDRKLNGDLLRDGNSPYKTQLTELNGSNLYSSGNMYLQSYPSFDDGYGHQHSPLESTYNHLPVEVNGLPDPYEEYEEKTPSFGEESVESGYSTSNSRGRRVIREIIV